MRLRVESRADGEAVEEVVLAVVEAEPVFAEAEGEAVGINPMCRAVPAL